MKKKKTPSANLGEVAACNQLGYRTDLMGRYCAREPSMNGKGGHAIKGNVHIGNRHKRSKRNYE